MSTAGRCPEGGGRPLRAARPHKMAALALNRAGAAQLGGRASSTAGSGSRGSAGAAVKVRRPLPSCSRLGGACGAGGGGPISGELFRSERASRLVRSPRGGRPGGGARA